MHGRSEVTLARARARPAGAGGVDGPRWGRRTTIRTGDRPDPPPNLLPVPGQFPSCGLLAGRHPFVKGRSWQPIPPPTAFPPPAGPIRPATSRSISSPGTTPGIPARERHQPRLRGGRSAGLARQARASHAQRLGSDRHARCALQPVRAGQIRSDRGRRRSVPQHRHEEHRSPLVDAARIGAEQVKGRRAGGCRAAGCARPGHRGAGRPDGPDNRRAGQAEADEDRRRAAGRPARPWRSGDPAGRRREPPRARWRSTSRPS